MRKKISIFVLAEILVGVAVFLQLTFTWNGEKLKNVVYKSNNLIIQQVQEGERNLIILGEGGSLSVDENDRIVHHDPFMLLPDIEFQNQTVLSVFYPFETDGLEEAGKELSAFVNTILPEYDTVTLIGHSKCGVCFANAVRWIGHPEKLTVFTISTPFYGTPVADKNAMFEKLNWFEYQAYAMQFSDHKVDRDIIPGSEFLQNSDFSGLRNCKHVNIMSKCPIQSQGFVSFLLKYLDKRAEISGDGIVPQASQSLCYPNTVIKQIEATHDISLERGIDIVKKMLVY